MNRVRRKMVVITLTVSLLAVVGCAPKRPILYPNAHLEKVGMQVGQADIDACITKAEAYGAGSGTGKDSGRNVATSAGVAAAAGAVFAAIVGGNVGEAALASGGAAAAGSAVYEASKSDDPGAIHRNFVTKCLEEKGYEVTGWK